jgi:hypothetical protein
MHTASQQMNVRHETQDMGDAGATRPEPMVPDRLSAIHEVAFEKTAGTPRAGSDYRSELAAAFRKLGRGLDAGAAYVRARAFYKSSGHKWTHSLD